MGSDGEVLMRRPREPLSWNVTTTTPVATRAAQQLFLTLSDRPTLIIDCSFLRIRDGRFLGRCGRSPFCDASTGRGDQVAVPHNDFMDDSLYAVALRYELALLDGPVNEDVVAFLEGRRNARKVAIERQVVPIGVLLRFTVAVLVSVAFPKTDIRDGCSGRKISERGLGRQIADDF
jgi:hypothetical protein